MPKSTQFQERLRTGAGAQSAPARKTGEILSMIPREQLSSTRPTIGCDVGGTNVKLVRIRGGERDASLEIPTQAARSPEEFLSALAEAIRSLRPGVQAVGVALPGFLDARRSRVVFLSNLPVLNGIALRQRLAARLRLPVVLDTDTNAGSVAEALLGAGRGYRRVLYLTMGTGLGAAFAIDGKPVRISHHTVGQVAHVPLDPAGPRCRCGERGCAEAILCARGIRELARRRGLRVASPFELWEVATGRRGASASRRSAACEIWKHIGGRLGALCIALGALLSPEAIVVGGGISAGAPLFLPEAGKALSRHLTPRIGRRVPILPARLGNYAGAMGAAILARGAFDPEVSRP